MSTVRSSILWVGMDVHKDSITVAVFRDREAEPLHVDRLPNDHKRIRRYIERLSKTGTPRACYEASGAGYVLQRALTEWGVPCDLAAPSLIPRRPGEHRKTDRRDAIKIARDFRDDRLALTPRYRPVVERICCFRGFKTQAAMVLATEIGDVRRFESPRQLMAYLGLVPGEHSSGERRRMGGITKAGNARVRHVLVQAAWSARRRPTVGAALQRRQAGQDPDVIGHAWKCQHRLYKLFHRLAARKPKQVAATAVARERVGFLWAVLRNLDPSHLEHTEVRDAA
ncbi:MAG: transposase [Acidimicrobiia bacterium]